MAKLERQVGLSWLLVPKVNYDPEGFRPTPMSGCQTRPLLPGAGLLQGVLGENASVPFDSKALSHSFRRLPSERTLPILDSDNVTDLRGSATPCQ